MISSFMLPPRWKIIISMLNPGRKYTLLIKGIGVIRGAHFLMSPNRILINKKLFLQEFTQLCILLLLHVHSVTGLPSAPRSSSTSLSSPPTLRRQPSRSLELYKCCHPL